MFFDSILPSQYRSITAKARLAVMRMDEKRYEEAHSLVKQALASGDKNPEIRAFYIYLLCHTGQIKPAKAFTFNVLKDDGHDVYALCAAGRLSYQEARESRDPSPAATAARKDNFLKAANIFVKALNIDPSCAIAAQGLAIIIAEDSLGSWAPGQAADDSQFKTRNARNARQALDILAKVRESLSDGSVYVNMGHCHFVREEYDKAIENVCGLNCKLKCITHSHCIAVRNGVKALLSRSKRLHTNVPLSNVVRQSHEGREFFCDASSFEILPIGVCMKVTAS